jgi:lysozyme
MAARHWATKTRLSQHGATFLAGEEGVRVRPYRDSSGWVTAGVGHLIEPRHQTITADDIRRWSFPSAAAAINYFRAHDVVGYEQAVRRAVGDHGLTQAQYDMCVSLCFNIGTGGFAGSRVAANIRAGNIRAAGDAFLGWANPRVLLGRRQRERARFLKGDWS